ncbi:YciI family protein [Actinotalea solisilvae]|uniref:YciI family protein n=1 Tax=Actinotalea solisilvae TaxID=2072922 RepID=UPI0018F1352A|nr:YciI family protein [Actinotalea solisilvae]
MSVYAVHYTYDQRTGERDRVRPAHRAFLGDLHDAGTLLASGPWAGPTHGVQAEPDGALLLVRAEDVAGVERLLDADPFALAGLVAGRSVRPWTPVFGPWTDDD